jgi:hypothetical protein
MGASEARILLEGNAFTLWLGGRLTALGYQVFADVLRLKGGDDWERVLEDAIRNKAKRFLLVATPGGVQKQSVRNEITIAIETAKRIKEDGFIVPLRLAAYAAPLQIAHAQYIDFEKDGPRAWPSCFHFSKRQMSRKVRLRTTQKRGKASN